MLTLALQTDSRGVTAVLAERPKVGAARLLGVATVEQVASAEKLAGALRAALPQVRGGKPQMAVALGPDEVRVKRLAVPPAPETELPPIVALQAARDAAVDAESIVADFASPQPNQEGPPTVLAAWTDAGRLAFWREVADDLGGKLVVVTPRPLAMAPATDAAESVLYLSRAGEAIDFVAFNAGSPVLLRSAHVGEGDAQRELRRTLLALSADAIEAPRVMPLHEGLLPAADIEVASWREKLAVDPSDSAGYDESLAATVLALRTAVGARPTINLADPRRPPVAETNRRRQLLLGAAAASVIAAGAWMAYDRVARLDRQIAEKQKEIAAAEEEVAAFEPYRLRVAAIDAWRQSDVNWLDELDRLSQKLRPVPLDAKEFPESSDIRVTQLIATSLLGSDEPGGRIDLTAVARSSSSSELESRLRDADHPVEPISTTESPAKDQYRFKYTALLRVPPDAGVGEEAAEPTSELSEETESAAVESEPAAKGEGAAPTPSESSTAEGVPAEKPLEAETVEPEASKAAPTDAEAPAAEAATDATEEATDVAEEASP